MKQIFFIAVLSSLLLASPGKADKWNVDVAHSTLSFEITHMVISKAKGRFTDFNGVINFEGDDIAKGSVEITAQTASVDTDNEDRDEHLRSAEFFEVEKYPLMSFKSTKVGEVKKGKFKLTGDLTIKDVTKEVTFDCIFRGVVNDPWGNTRTGFSAVTTINRQDFNVAWSSVLEGGGLTLGNDVEIKLEIEAIKAKPKASPNADPESAGKDATE